MSGRLTGENYIAGGVVTNQLVEAGSFFITKGAGNITTPLVKSLLVKTLGKVGSKNLAGLAGNVPGSRVGDATHGIATNTSTKLLPEAYSRFSRFEYHFEKHAGEFGAAGKDAYYKRALSLLDGPVGGNVEGFTNSAGYTFRMNMRTGEFGVMRPNGVVETFYRRLSDPAKYWAEQVAKWNK